MHQRKFTLTHVRQITFIGIAWCTTLAPRGELIILASSATITTKNTQQFYDCRLFWPFSKLYHACFGYQKPANKQTNKQTEKALKNNESQNNNGNSAECKLFPNVSCVFIYFLAHQNRIVLFASIFVVICATKEQTNNVSNGIVSAGEQQYANGQFQDNIAAESIIPSKLKRGAATTSTAGANNENQVQSSQINLGKISCGRPWPLPSPSHSNRCHEIKTNFNRYFSFVSSVSPNFEGTNSPSGAGVISYSTPNSYQQFYSPNFAAFSPIYAAAPAAAATPQVIENKKERKKEKKKWRRKIRKLLFSMAFVRRISLTFGITISIRHHVFIELASMAHKMEQFNVIALLHEKICVVTVSEWSMPNWE